MHPDPVEHDTQEDYDWTSADNKPEGREPGWYFSWTGCAGWHIWAGRVWGRLVFNFDTPWFVFGYAW